MLELSDHGVTTRTGRSAAAVGFAAILVVAAPAPRISIAQDAPDTAAQALPPAAWPTSPFHGVTSGATGAAIPCRCRFKGTDFRLGDTVCMQTPHGIQIARCDLVLNNTSWMPMGVPCTMSGRAVRLAAGTP